MIDSGNEVFINETLTYLNSEKFKTARQHYIDKFGEDFIKTEYNNIRVIADYSSYYFLAIENKLKKKSNELFEPLYLQLSQAEKNLK